MVAPPLRNTVTLEIAWKETVFPSGEENVMAIGNSCGSPLSSVSSAKSRNASRKLVSNEIVPLLLSMVRLCSGMLESLIRERQLGLLVWIKASTRGMWRHNCIAVPPTATLTTSPAFGVTGAPNGNRRKPLKRNCTRSKLPLPSYSVPSTLVMMNCPDGFDLTFVLVVPLPTRDVRL